MDQRPIIAKGSAKHSEQLFRHWGLGLAIASLLLVIGLTLLPFDFSFQPISLGQIIRRMAAIFSIDILDIVANVLFFLPLGVSLTASLRHERLSASIKLLIIACASCMLSFTVELLQNFLPSRDPSLVDVLTNTVGGILGFYGFQWRAHIVYWLRMMGQFGKRRLSAQLVMAAFTGYVAIILIGAVILQPSTSFSNWDPTYPLMVGNEKTGDRPWQGSVSELYIANQAIPASAIGQILSGANPTAAMGRSLQAAYRLTGTGNYQDQTGKLPDLAWQGSPPAASSAPGVTLSADHWLATKTSVAPISQQLQSTSQFTLVTTVAAANTSQQGLSRIVSISNDSKSRNLTLGQQETDLVFRLRTPFSGNNGNQPEIVFPNIFNDTNLHRLVLTYNGSVLSLYLDSLQNSYINGFAPRMTPLQLLASLKSSNKQHLVLTQVFFKLLYYALLFIPAGALLGVLLARSNRAKLKHYSPSNRIGSSLAVYACAFLPALLLEIILAQSSGTPFLLENLLYGFGFSFGSMLLMYGRINGSSTVLP